MAEIRRPRPGEARRVHAAFAAGLGLWAAFLLADEVFIAFAVEGMGQVR